MASSPGKWEVVGKGGKTKKNIQGNKKPKTKLNEADLPKLDIKAPIPESKSQFHAFAKSKETPFVIPKDEVESDSDNPDDVSSEVSRQPERRRKHHNKEPKLSLEELVEEALKTCDKTATKTFILETKEKYSNNQLVMLKELTRYLQDYFQSASVEKDPVLGDQQPGFPLCCLGEDIQGLVIGELYECSEDEIDKLFIHCLDEMLIEINKGRATYGIRMIIQSLVKCFPLVAVKDQKEHLIRVESRKNNSREALSLLWVFGQTSDHQDMVDKMAAWTSFMLPVIECKQLSKYVVEYLETTLSFQLPDTVSDPLLPGNEFQYVMEMAFGTTYQHFPYRRQLQLLYREIKTVAFAAYPKVPLTGTFSRLFDSLGSDLGEQYTQEALCCLVECLEKDPTCHFKWRNNYLARLKESGLLLKTLVEHWNSVCRSIPGKYLSETLREFQNVNNELKTREKQKAGLSECETSCKTLLNAISINPPPSKSESSRFNRIIKLFLLFLLAAVCVDLYKHSGYQGTRAINSKIIPELNLEIPAWTLS